MKRIPSTAEQRRDAYRLWCRWNQRHPDRRFNLAPDIGKEVEPIGYVDEINYFSDKYCRKCRKCGYHGVPEEHRSVVCPECRSRTEPSSGVFELYTHDSDSGPCLYKSAVPGTGQNTLELVGLRQWPTSGSRVDVAVMGKADSIVYEDSYGAKKRVGFRSSMLVAPNDRTIVIVREGQRSLIIRGGRMRITADGIVH